MTEQITQIANTAGRTFDITLAELAGANSGQRNDLLVLSQAIYRVPSGALYTSNGAQLVAATGLPVTATTNPLTGGIESLLSPNGTPLRRAYFPRWGADYERTPGEPLLNVESVSLPSPSGTTPSSSAAISSSVLWGGLNTVRLSNNSSGNGATANFSWNLAAPFPAPKTAPTLFFPVYIPDYTTVENMRLMLSMGDTTFTNAFEFAWPVGPTGHGDKMRPGWHLVSASPAEWTTAAGAPVWTSTINAIRVRFVNRDTPLESSVFVGRPIVGRSATPQLMIYADDVHSSFYTHALPIFDSYGLKVNLALAKNWVGAANYMSLEQYLDAQRRGHEICVHTTNRVGVQLTDVPAAVADIQDNRDYVRDVIKARWGHKHFVWANGQYWISSRSDMSVVDAVRDQLGFELGRTTDDVLRTTTRTSLGMSNTLATRYNMLTMPEIGPWDAQDGAAIKAAIDLVVARRHVGALVFHPAGMANDGAEWTKPGGIESIAEHISGLVSAGKLLVQTGEEFATGLYGAV